MKAMDKNDGLKPVTYRLPPEIIEKMEELSNIDRRSINDTVITILQDYLDMPVKWETWIINTIKEIAIEKKYTISWALNYLVANALNEVGRGFEKYLEDQSNSKTA